MILALLLLGVSAEFAPILTAIAALIGTLATAWLTFRSSTKQNRRQIDIDSRKVDSEIYRSSRNDVEFVINTLKSEVERLQREVTVLRHQLNTEEALSLKLRARVTKLEAHILSTGAPIPNGDK